MVLKEHELGFDTFKVLQIIFPLVIHYPTIQLFIIGWLMVILVTNFSTNMIYRFAGGMLEKVETLTV